jgi:phenylpyruvate tautomerase PptA (4-oxalocrotonate tautomerase family)
MPEVRLKIPDDVIDSLQKAIGSDYKATDIAIDAITLYNWAVKERAKGRFVLSSEPEGGDMARLIMPSIEKAAPDK